MVSTEERNAIIRELMNHPTATVLFRNVDGVKKVFFKIHNEEIELTDDMTYSEVENLIHPECLICLISDKNIQNSQCVTCSKIMCDICFIKHFIETRGIAACPFCRHTDQIDKWDCKYSIETLECIIRKYKHDPVLYIRMNNEILTSMELNED